MTISVPPELRESQLSIIVQGLDQFYSMQTISYAQLEEALHRMSEEDLQAALVYSQNADLRGIAEAVLVERGTEVAALPQPPSPFPQPQPIPEVLF